MRNEKIELNISLNKKNVLNNNIQSDSDSDEQCNKDNIKEYLKDKVNIEILKNQDNNIQNYEFDFDSFYDATAPVKKIENKLEPKYMSTIKQNSQRNNLEKMINKNKIENKKFKINDESEVFITNGYKQKLKELNMITQKEYISNDTKINSESFLKIYEQNKSEINQEVETDEIVDKAKYLSDLVKTMKPKNNTDNLSKEDKIKKFKENYLERKRQREKNENNN